MTAGLPRVGELVVQGDGVCGRAESPPRGAVLGGGAGFSALTIMASFLLLLCAPHFPARHRAFAPATLPKTSPPSRNLVRIRPRSLRFRHQFLTEPPDQVSAPPRGHPTFLLLTLVILRMTYRPRSFPVEGTLSKAGTTFVLLAAA